MNYKRTYGRMRLNRKSWFRVSCNRLVLSGWTTAALALSSDLGFEFVKEGRHDGSLD